jgi:hypothetical protein
MFNSVVITAFIYYSNTQGSRALPKLAVAQLVRKDYHLSLNLKIHYRVHKSQLLDPVLRQMN